MSFIKGSFAPHPLHSREEYMTTWINLCKELGITDVRGACACTAMCALQEAGARDGVGVQQIWCPGNNADPCFRADPNRFPHDSMADDGKSVGSFQQQTSGPPPASQWGWGGLYGDPEGTRKRMDMYESSKLFMTALKKSGFNASNANTANDSVQRVQGSGVPTAYAKWWNEANELYDKVTRGGVTPPVLENPVNDALTPVPGFRGDPVWLADVLRAEGLNVIEMDGWKERGEGDQGVLWGAVFHHTGNANETPEGIAFHPTLGLAAHLLIRPNGDVYVCGIGKANHAGKGSWAGMVTDNANPVTIGVEVAILPVENAPHRSGWPDVQYFATVKTMAAILRKLAKQSSNVISHKEWAQLGPAGWRQGKWDPGAIDMNIFRQDVQKQITIKNGGTTEDMANVPQAEWDEVKATIKRLGRDIFSGSIYAPKGEKSIGDIVQVVTNLDRNGGFDVLTDKLAVEYHDEDSIKLIMQTAKGLNQYGDDAKAVGHAKDVLSKIPDDVVLAVGTKFNLL
jgi:hypothetical protein